MQKLETPVLHLKRIQKVALILSTMNVNYLQTTWCQRHNQMFPNTLVFSEVIHLWKNRSFFFHEVSQHVL